ncbi:hypothetical protein [Pontibacterium sp.]|uniref:hypothetical protein n=1 Tax=Pontibacterium sp. TaxID=2036026 RepID=UPI003516C8E8
MMTYRVFIAAHSAIYALFALGLYFLPDQLWPLYGVEINDQYGRFLSQHTSIFLGGVAIIGWTLKQIEEVSVQRSVLAALAWTNLLGEVITLRACFEGIFVGFGWSDPLFFSVLTAVSVWQMKRVAKA